MYKLLIVDDEQYILDGLKSTLDWQALGFTRVETAATYHQAVDMAIGIEPHLAIFDVRLEGCYGYDIIKQLNQRGLATKYIMMSGYGEFEYARQAIVCGAKAYLLKPIDRAELLTMVEKVIVEDLGGSLPRQGEGPASREPVLGMQYARLSKLVNKILMIVQTDFGSSLSLKTVAEMFKMNSAYLGQIFLREAHVKFSEYLMAYRMIKAREMILNSDEKIAYIARKVGYCNLNYFYTHFRDFYNVSPTDLRTDAKEEGKP